VAFQSWSALRRIRQWAATDP